MGIYIYVYEFAFSYCVHCCQYTLGVLLGNLTESMQALLGQEVVQPSYLTS